MNWIRVKDMERPISDRYGPHAKTVYELLRAAAGPDGLVEKPIDVQNMLQIAVDSGSLRTMSKVPKLFQSVVSKLKSAGYVETDKPLVHVRKARPIQYRFLDNVDRHGWELPHTAIQFWEKRKGTVISEQDLWSELIEIRSPHGSRTMWDVFKWYRHALIDVGLLRMEVKE